MARTFDGIWWSVEVPDGWTAQPGDECATFQAKAPLGALQISSARKDNAAVTDEELQEFARERVPRINTLSRVDYPNFSGFSASYAKGSESWHEWWLKSGNTMIYATYNADLGIEDREREYIEQILHSLKAIS